MLGKRFAFALMAAVGLAMSVGGPAVASTGEAPPRADGPVTLKHRVTHQECAFDNVAAASDFMANVADPDSWDTKERVDAELAAVENTGAGYSEIDQAGVATTTTEQEPEPAPDTSTGDGAELLPGGEAVQGEPAADAAAAGTTEGAESAAAEVTEPAKPAGKRGAK